MSRTGRAGVGSGEDGTMRSTLKAIVHIGLLYIPQIFLENTKRQRIVVESVATFTVYVSWMWSEFSSAKI